jgi:hypothetical protein
MQYFSIRQLDLHHRNLSDPRTPIRGARAEVVQRLAFALAAGCRRCGTSRPDGATIIRYDVMDVKAALMAALTDESGFGQRYLAGVASLAEEVVNLSNGFFAAFTGVKPLIA